MSYSRYGGGGSGRDDRYGGGRDDRRSGRDGRDDRYGRSSSSNRRDNSPPRHRSRRSASPGPSRESPKPRDPSALPEAFGGSQVPRTDDDLSVLQRMRTSYVNSPLAVLYRYLERKDKVKIWTRNYKEVRGVMTGYIVAFDKHWNIVLSDVDEVYLKFKKCKTPFLRDVAPNENLADFPPKIQKNKKKPESEPPKETESPKPESKAEGESEKKKKRRAKKPKATSEKRHVKMLFIRGDNIVIISPAVVDDDDEEEGETSHAEEVRGAAG